ncbi:ATP phosphoribosyltransferase [Anaeroselena agilis]|uniref:ATP phosphoribosyltransferase n=1 Tax=Anaeroselena agilis TaxID=3063788 RepID=A0ABU3NVD8_9FIRM|nr:ATP phosphoribosyltransferase [Selenomonadales bacterium 4137-cl]
MTSSDMNYLTIALPKGKLFAPAARLLAAAGYTADGLSEDSRRLVIANEAHKIRFIITKTADLPTYVEYGAADVGIIGKDVLAEENKNVYELLDLKFGLCRMVVAVPEALRQPKLADYAHMRVATKYPNTAEKFFRDAGIQMEIIKLGGSIELAPIVGLAEMIVDLVETGRTLKENKLVEVAQINQATARFIANRVSFKMKFERINRLTEELRQLAESGSKA